MDSQKDVIPAKAGIQGLRKLLKFLDSRFRGNDGHMLLEAFCEDSKYFI